MKRVLIIVVLLGACVILLPFVVPVFAPWSAINCSHQDINIKTGQARFSRYIWYICVHEEVVDTPLSIALQGKEVNVADIEPWHRANTFFPGVHHSPHYCFHAALNQAKYAGDIFELTNATPDRKREIAETILKLWQQNGSYFEAGKYLSGLEKGLWEKETHKTPRGRGG